MMKGSKRGAKRVPKAFRGRMERLAEKLPKTVDGVPVVNGMKLCRRGQDGLIESRVVKELDINDVDLFIHLGCYSTRAAAEQGAKP